MIIIINNNVNIIIIFSADLPRQLDKPDSILVVIVDVLNLLLGPLDNVCRSLVYEGMGINSLSSKKS